MKGLGVKRSMHCIAFGAGYIKGTSTERLNIEVDLH